MHIAAGLLGFQPHWFHLVAGTVSELWHHWWYPRIAPDDPKILGFPLIWWGRGGKALEFISGTVIVLDLIGSKRLHHWGHEIQGKKMGSR
jgi:hypothetical protein